MSGFIGGISTSFTIQDNATPALSKIADGLKSAEDLLDAVTKSADNFSKIRFGGVTRSLGAMADQFDNAATAAERLEKIRFSGLNRSIQGLDRQVSGLTANVDALPIAFESAMNRMAAESVRGEAAINALEAAMLRTIATARGLGAAAGGIGGIGGIGGGGGRGGGGGSHGRGHVYATPSGLHGGARFATSIPGLALGLGVYEGVKMQAEYDMALRNATMSLGEADPDSPQGREMRGTLDRTLRGATSGTKFSLDEVAPVLSDFYGMVSPGVTGTPAEKASKLEGLTGRALRFSETESQAGHGGLAENMRTSAEFAHLLRAYSPEDIQPRLDKLLAISRLTGRDPQEIERVMKYSVTTGGLAGVDPDSLLSMTGFLIQSGITGTTAGTGLAQVINSIMKGEKPPGGSAGVEHLHKELSVRQEFERAMHGQVGIEKHIDAQRKAKGPKDTEVTKDLIALGVLDPDSHKLMPGMQGPTGGINEAAVIQQMVGKAASMPGHEGGRLIEGAMGTRGARALEPFMGEGGKIFQQYMEMEKKYTEEIGVAITQLHQSQAPLQEMQQAWARFKEFLMAAVGPLDSLGKYAKGAADGLEKLTNWLNTHQLPELHAGTPSEMMGRGPDSRSNMSPSHALDPLFNWLFPPKTSEHRNEPMLSGPHALDHGGFSPPTNFVPAEPHQSIVNPNIQRESSNTGGGVHVNIQNVSFGPGAARDHADQFVRELTASLSRSQLNDLGTGWGHQQSSYTTGRTVSV